MHDLETIKRLNRNPSKRFDRDKPAPQPTREESYSYWCRANGRVYERRFYGQGPADDTRSGYISE